MSGRPRYEAILFDVGDTLLNVVRDPQQMAVEAVAHLGALSATAYAAGVRQAVAEWRNAGGRPELEDLPETWISHNSRALAIAGFRGDIATAAQLMEDTFLADGWELYPDVTDTLAVLGSHEYRMGVVSNWPATLEATLQSVGLRRHFSVIVASGTVGYAKPHPQIFRIAAERLKVDPPDALYIGDSVEHDVRGATGAGMDAVLLDRTGRREASDQRIQTLSQLPELLEILP